MLGANFLMYFGERLLQILEEVYPGCNTENQTVLDRAVKRHAAIRIRLLDGTYIANAINHDNDRPGCE